MASALNFKSKFKTLLSSLQRDKGVGEESSWAAAGGDHEETAELPSQSGHRSSPSHKEEQLRIDEILESVDEIYYCEEEQVDTSEHELRKLSGEMEELMQRILILKQQDNAIYRKIFDLVFANYTAYVQELENVTALEMSLQDASRTCISARRQLRIAKEGVSHGGLGLLAKHRKRERLKVLLDVLKTFKTLQRAGTRLRELLQEGEYPSATQLCIECQHAIETYKQFQCVRELAVSLQDIQTLIEDELEQALSSMVTSFNPNRYQLVQDAYRILGKTQRAIDLLLMKFTSGIHDKAFATVAEYVKKSGCDEAQLTKTPFANLCKLVDADQFIECLLELCKTLWRVMHNYYQIRHWHSESRAPASTPLSLLSAHLSSEDDERSTAELAFDRNYVKQKLDNGLVRIWRDVQQKVRPYLLAVDMSSFQYDSVIKVLDMVNRLISIGVEFCGEGSDTLQESMRQQSLSYFRSYHRGRLEELRLFLENEQWVLCPVRASFSLSYLREFRFMRRTAATPTVSPPRLGTNNTASLKRKIDTGSCVFGRYSSDGNPFEDEAEEEDNEDIVMDTSTNNDEASDEEHAATDDNVADELKQDYVDERTGELPVSKRTLTGHRRPRSHSTMGPILANVTLTVVRFWGNYMQMMTILQPIAPDVLECLTHLFDYYLYAVYTFFAQDLIGSEELLSAKLTTSLKRISETLLLPKQDSAPSTPSSPEDSLKVPHPVTNPFMQLDNSASLFGLSFRLVAIESLVFLARQFELLVPYIESLIPDRKKNFLSQFFSHTVSPCHELRQPVYCAVVSRGLPYDQIVQAMSSVKWDVKEIMSLHSPYVDQLLREFDRFKEMLLAIERHVHTPPEATRMLWDHAIKRATRTFVDGFAQTKKCSNEGRALMQLDFQQFRTKLEKMSGLRPLPHHSFVEDYIRAYYMSEVDLEQWLIHHQEYSHKQLQALVVCGAGGHLNKKARQRLLASIDAAEQKHQ